MKNDYIKKDPRTKQANDLAKRAYAYGKKNKLDLDDGGGGSKTAGKRYNSMWEKHEKLTSSINKDASYKTNTILKSKYGEKRIKQIGRENTAIAIGALAGISIGAGFTVSFITEGSKLVGRSIIRIIKRRR